MSKSDENRDKKTQDPKLYFRKKLMHRGKWERKFHKHNRLWKLFVISYFVALFISSDHVTAGYFLNKRLGITKDCTKTYRIAIIDSAFDLDKINRKQIIAQRNITHRSSVISKVPMFDYSGNIKFSNHGTDIANLFIGKHGLLKNAQIIPIQIQSDQDLPAALEHALNNGAQAISISLSFAPSYRQLSHTAKTALLKTAKTVPILIAAGNDGQSLESNPYGKSLLTLAQASDCKENTGRIFLVAATKFSVFGLGNLKFEKLADFSNYSKYNSKYVLRAPGQNIKLGNIANQTFGINSLHGTSIATPLALIKAIYLINNKQNSHPITITQALTCI